MLLLDEPFGALDAKVRKELRQGLRDIHDTTGLTTSSSPMIRKRRWSWPICRGRADRHVDGPDRTDRPKPCRTSAPARHPAGEQTHSCATATLHRPRPEPRQPRL
jgi:hypothetical protein